MASSTAPPLKGILKKSTSSSASVTRATAAVDLNDDADDDGAPSSSAGVVARSATHSRRRRAEQDAEAIARQHAVILQQRRDLETTIFTAIEQLVDFPRTCGEGVSAAAPAAADADAFRQLVRIFQPGDYDDLVEERNTYGHCGYALCSRPRQTFAGQGTWKLVNAGRRDFGIVPKRELEKWCSPACARRALYIKVQLSETAAWERVGIPDIQVELLEEPEAKAALEAKDAKTEDTTDDTAEGTAEGTTEGKTIDNGKSAASAAQLAQDLARLKLHEERRLVDNARALAVERGDAGVAGADADVDMNGCPLRAVPPPPAASLVDVNIVEKKVIMAATAPTLDAAHTDPHATEGGGDAAHMIVEGYKTRFASS